MKVITGLNKELVDLGGKQLDDHAKVKDLLSRTLAYARKTTDPYKIGKIADKFWSSNGSIELDNDEYELVKEIVSQSHKYEVGNPAITTKQMLDVIYSAKDKEAK